MLKLFKKLFIKNRKLSSRLLTYFVLLSMLPIILLSIVNYYLYSQIIKYKALQFSVQAVDQIAYEIDNTLTGAEKISTMVSFEPMIQETLRNPLDEDIAKRYSNDLLIDSRLYFIQSYIINDFSGIYVIGKNGGCYKSSYFSFKDGDFRNTDWFKKIINSKETICFGTSIGSLAVQSEAAIYITIGMPIVDKSSGENIGAILIDFKEDLLFENIKETKLGDSGYVFILDGSKNIIPYADSDLILSRFSDNMDYFRNLNQNENKIGYIKSNDEKSIVFSKDLKYGWKIIGVVPNTELVKDSMKIATITIVIALVLCVFAVTSSWRISNSLTKPIAKLVQLMKSAENGDFSVKMNVENNDEIGHLANGFNVMLDKIQALMKSLYEEHEKLHKAELRALQAQINPHFLYNTLDSISWLSRANKNDMIIKMVTALTRLFRIALSKGADIISIKDEIEHVNNYLTIQSIRYRNKFTYEINVPEKLAKYRIIKLIIQPIVENAIYHGIKNKRNKGHISINAYDIEEYVVFEVTDTGIGMTSDRLASIEKMIAGTDGMDIGEYESYGILNVSERMRIFYKNDYSLKYYSEYGIGTKVEIKIPKWLEGVKNDKSIYS